MEFIYHNFNIDKNIVVFEYEIKDVSKFYHKLIFPFELTDKNIIFNIGLIEAISYYKLTISEKFIIKCGYINKEQQKWFKKLYLKGLGEFLYINQIKKDNLFEFIIESKEAFDINNKKLNNEILIPIGGGKDSFVTYELLKDYNTKLFAINPIEASKTILKDTDIEIKRVLDNQLLELNKTKKYLNGHIPFSAVVAFITTLVAVENNIKYIALSNENSANEENVIFNNLKINHQYSKTFEFENDFRYYSKKYLNQDVEYFSFLRPLQEIQIAYIFSKFSKYHYIFRSCNVGSKKNIWCNNCSKCLFVFIILSPFIEKDKLIKIFGSNMLDNKDLEKIFLDLIIKDRVKPFECVGSYDEVNWAMERSYNSYLKSIYQKLNLPKAQIDIKKLSNNHNLNEFFVNILQKYIL